MTMFYRSCVKHYHQNALFCLSHSCLGNVNQISKRYLVDIAQTTVFLDEKQKKIVSGNHKICNKHLASVWKMIYLCRILLIPSLLITFDSLIWHLLNQLFCETVPWYNISSNGPQLLKKMQHLVTSATHAFIF